MWPALGQVLLGARTVIVHARMVADQVLHSDGYAPGGASTTELREIYFRVAIMRI
jgi:hypothetical protein